MISQRVADIMSEVGDYYGPEVDEPEDAINAAGLTDEDLRILIEHGFTLSIEWAEDGGCYLFAERP